MRRIQARRVLLESCERAAYGTSISEPWEPPSQTWSSAWTPAAQRHEAYATFSSRKTPDEPTSMKAEGLTSSPPARSPNRAPQPKRLLFRLQVPSLTYCLLDTVSFRSSNIGHMRNWAQMAGPPWSRTRSARLAASPPPADMPDIINLSGSIWSSARLPPTYFSPA